MRDKCSYVHMRDKCSYIILNASISYNDGYRRKKVSSSQMIDLFSLYFIFHFHFLFIFSIFRTARVRDRSNWSQY